MPGRRKSQPLRSWVRRAIREHAAHARAFPESGHYDVAKNKVVKRGPKGTKARPLQPREWRAVTRHHRQLYRLLATRALDAVFGKRKDPRTQRIRKIIHFEMQELLGAKRAVAERRIPERVYAAVRLATSEYIDFILKTELGLDAVKTFHATLDDRISHNVSGPLSFWHPHAVTAGETEHIFAEATDEATLRKMFERDLSDAKWEADRANRKLRGRKHNLPPDPPMPGQGAAFDVDLG